MTLTVACVLKSGGDYRPQHVYELRDGVKRHLSVPYEFVCLTDMSVDCLKVPLVHDWSGWWSKIELFGRFMGPVLYFDLDTKIVGSLDKIALGNHHFTVLENFWAKDYNDPQRIGSGMMAWNTPLVHRIYEAFLRSPELFMRSYRTKAQWGDQAFIRRYYPGTMHRWQHRYPGKVISFKKHVLPVAGVPGAASVVCFHGQPRPWNLTPEQQSWFNVDLCEVSL